MTDVVPSKTASSDTSAKPIRKSMFLGPEALQNLKTTSARRRTEREAMEEALQLLAEHDARMDAMDEFIEWALEEWGEPSDEAKARADEIWEQLK